MSGPIPEPEVHVPTSRPLWLALLSGPSLWFGHFMAVYLLAEIACAGSQPALLDIGAVLATVVALAVLAVAAWMTWAAWRRLDDPPGDDALEHALDPVRMQRVLLAVGLLLDALFAVAILFNAVPVLVLPPC